MMLQKTDFTNLNPIISIPNIDSSILAARNDVGATWCNAWADMSFETLASHKILHNGVQF